MDNPDQGPHMAQPPPIHHPRQRIERNNLPRMNLEDLMQFANNNVIQLFGGTIQLRVSKFLDILLRLPPLFLMDQILLHDMGFNYFNSVDPDKNPLEPKIHITYTGRNESNGGNHSYFDEYQEMLANGTSGPELEQSFMEHYKDALSIIAFNHFVSVCSCLLLFWFSMLWISLSTKQLLWFYLYVGTLTCLPSSYLVNNFTIDAIRSGTVGLQSSEPGLVWIHNFILSAKGSLIQILFVNYVSQAAFASIICNIGRSHMSGYPFLTEDLLNRSVIISLFMPTVIELLGIQCEHSTVISLIPATIVSIFILSKVIGSAIQSVMLSISSKRQFINNFGLNTFLEAEWVRLRIPSLLRTFWLTRMTQQLLGMIAKNGISDQGLTYSDAAARVAVTYMLEVGRELVIRGAETLIALLGMTSVISKLCHYVGSFFHLLLANTTENEEEKSVASVSAILFFILALQTGLTSLEPEKRFSRICKNLCLLLTALFHFIHNNVSPVLMSLTAGQRSSSEIQRHLRALSICFFLIVASLSLMIILWQWFTIGTWLLAVSAFCIEVVVKVIVTVSVYGLFLYDARVREGTWEGLDDAVYYVKAVGNSVEFCFAVFLFFNGGWILFFESGGTIRAIMMVVHAYFNIWCEAKSGWRTFMKRRTAVTKINSLHDATSEELQRHNDVCAICYMEMSTAKVTQCRHYFHSVCLKKWLYMQDTCPLCHSVLYVLLRAPASAQTDAGGNPQPQEAGDEANESDNDLNDLVDHDDPPYQAPILIEQDSSSSDSDEAETSSSSASTGLTSSEDDFEDEIIFDTFEPEVGNLEALGQDSGGDEEEILNLMETPDSDISDNDNTNSSGCSSSQGEIIDR